MGIIIIHIIHQCILRYGVEMTISQLAYIIHKDKEHRKHPNSPEGNWFLAEVIMDSLTRHGIDVEEFVRRRYENT